MICNWRLVHRCPSSQSRSMLWKNIIMLTVEAVHIANQLCQYGYFFPVNDSRTLTVKDDSSLYRFQVLAFPHVNTFSKLGIIEFSSTHVRHFAISNFQSLIILQRRVLKHRQSRYPINYAHVSHGVYHRIPFDFFFFYLSFQLLVSCIQELFSYHPHKTESVQIVLQTYPPYSLSKKFPLPVPPSWKCFVQRLLVIDLGL